MATKPHTTNFAASLAVADVRRLVDQHFPALSAGERCIDIESVAARTARCRLVPAARHIRPGGTVSGPALFELADVTIYVALIGTLGAPAITAVTSNLNINFLARPAPTDVIADATLVRIGRRLAYAEVRLHSLGHPELIAHATGSYALTPQP